MYSIAIHGGAGAIPADLFARDEGARYRASLSSVLDAGYAILERGGSSLDAVTCAVRALEDDPLFNAGHGAALTREGWAELDAAVMDGKDQRAGAVASVRHVKNPIDLARRVMEKSRHVLLVSVGRGRVRAGRRHSRSCPTPTSAQTSVSSSSRRSSEGSGFRILMPMGAWRGHRRARSARSRFDKHGNLAAATSTGGMTNKRQGRVGDSPIIGAGTYAKNGVCAISATGHGEYFIRAVAAYHIASSVEYRGLSLEAAARELVHTRIPTLGGNGGIIAIGARGEIVMDFNTEGMFRAARDSAGRREVAVLRDDTK